MSDNVGNAGEWIKPGQNPPKAVTTQQDHLTVQTGHDTQRPSTNSDIGKLFNRMHPSGVVGRATDTYGQ